MSRSRLRPVGLAFAVVLLLSASVGSGVASATTESTAQSGLLSQINNARASLGLRAYRSDPLLASLAVKRARFMAATGELSHTTYGGDIGPAVSATGLSWLALGEDVAMADSATGASTATVLFTIWKNSPQHWENIISNKFNYIGIGVALTPSGAPFGALVFAETPDHTAPVVSLTSVSASGRTITWRWKGSDVLLQTHTAGFCTFDVAYRLDTGAWQTLRSKTRSTSLVLSSRPVGHVYSVRILGRDCTGNVSAWSAAKSIRLR